MLLVYIVYRCTLFLNLLALFDNLDKYDFKKRKKKDKKNSILKGTVKASQWQVSKLNGDSTGSTAIFYIQSTVEKHFYVIKTLGATGPAAL